MIKPLIAATLLALASAAAFATASVGQPAPAFSALDTSGKAVKLSDFKGRHVVLEWVNPECPFVEKHYGSANMQSTQKDAQARGVVWLAINSTHTGHSEYKTPAQMAQWMQAQKAAASATLLDSDGSIGRAYGARTTPHLYIVDPAGTLVYAGGIDNRPTADPADIPVATNHVKAALAEALAGQRISQPATRPYGCSVKYASLP